MSKFIHLGNTEHLFDLTGNPIESDVPCYTGHGVSLESLKPDTDYVVKSGSSIDNQGVYTPAIGENVELARGNREALAEWAEDWD